MPPAGSQARSQAPSNFRKEPAPSDRRTPGRSRTSTGDEGLKAIKVAVVDFVAGLTTVGVAARGTDISIVFTQGKCMHGRSKPIGNVCREGQHILEHVNSEGKIQLENVMHGMTN